MIFPVCKSIDSRRVDADDKKQTSIKVVVRCRDNNSQTLSIDPVNPTIFIKNTNTTITFHDVFSCNASQQDVFQSIGIPVVNKCLSGMNAAVLAYGQSGTGKTYTLQGNLYDNSQWGLIPRIANECFRRLISSKNHFEVQCSMLEIYRENIRDLFAIGAPFPTLRLRDGPDDVFVENLIEKNVQSLSELMRLYSAGLKGRATATTALNQTSSRSHLIICLRIIQHEKNIVKSGKLFLIDLAGSERVSKSKVEGSHFDEGRNINLSLSSLGNVVNALVRQDREHIPYRDSKLTRILQPVFGGDSVTYLICTISGDPAHESETISTLQFGERCGAITNKPLVHVEETSSTDDSPATLIAQLQAEIVQLKNQVAMMSSTGQTLAPRETSVSISSGSASSSSSCGSEEEDDYLPTSEPATSVLGADELNEMIARAQNMCLDRRRGTTDTDEESPDEEAISSFGDEFMPPSHIRTISSNQQPSSTDQITAVPPEFTVRYFPVTFDQRCSTSSGAVTNTNGEPSFPYNFEGLIERHEATLNEQLTVGNFHDLVHHHHPKGNLLESERRLVNKIFNEYKVLLSRYADCRLEINDLEFKLQQAFLVIQLMAALNNAKRKKQTGNNNRARGRSDRSLTSTKSSMSTK